MLHTQRLELIPATLTLARSEIESREEFSRLLGAHIPDNWPPVTLADALPWFLEQLEASPESVGWLTWYGVFRSNAQPVLIGGIGFKGPPQQDGTVEMGYSVLPQYQGNGYATEMVSALIPWAFSQKGVSRILAETGLENGPSRRILSNQGFVMTGEGSEPGGVLYQLPAFTGECPPGDESPG